MDSKRFDNWTKNRALRLSRRNALKLMGAGGAAAAVPGLTLDTLAQGSCSLTIHGQTDGGPSTGTTHDGTLTFSIGPDGTFAQASFTPASGGTLQAYGAATGRAIDFQVVLSGNQMLAFSGAAEQPLTVCQGAAAGVLSGPQPGDLGAWQSTGGSSSLPAPSGGSSSSGSGSGGSTLQCPPPQSACGQNCCSGGAICTDASQGLCACPAGTEQCGTNCVNSCSDGQPLDLDSCTCPDPEPACIQNQQTCDNHGQCCSGYCGGGTCFDCPGKVCGDFGCIDPSKDSQNCGNCGNVCVYPQVCSGGVCGCAPNGSPCASYSECCSGACTNGICTQCQLGFTDCGNKCVDIRSNTSHCGACGNVCPQTSPGVICVSGVCRDVNNDDNYCGNAGIQCPPEKCCYAGICGDLCDL